VSDGDGAAELLLAGASAVQVGTATFADPRAGADVLAGLTRWCASQGVREIGEVVGGVHGHAPPPGPAPVERAPVEQARVEQGRIEERR
jgi:dihydroorotate dehydrogenase (NAD+) catalytic subunit